MIEPRTLKGFRDYLPAAMMPRERLLDTARRVYRSYGFSPIDTPALEYLDVLTGKGGEESDRQLYSFQDRGERWVGMRFDLTVPLARFVAQHLAELGTPFKRYHLATVWRGENAQRGRYREFMQCDFDTVGTRSLAADVETALVIHDLLLALGIERFTIRVNNRRLLTGLLARWNLVEQTAGVLRALDKLPKIGPAAVAEEMHTACGLDEPVARQIIELASLSGTNAEILSALAPRVAGSEVGEQGLAELAELSRLIAAAGVPAERVQLDVSIARGLDYYTGTVFETFLDDLPTIGSICSGGRYDNLASLFTKQELPGIGASLGLDRLLAALEELGRIERVSTPAPVFIPYFVPQRLGDYLHLARALRSAGLGVEVFPEPKKLGQQLKYADRRGFRLAVVIGEDEFAAGHCQLKHLADGSSQQVALDVATLVTTIQQALATARD